MAMFITGPGSPFPTGSNPVSLATADLNGDGHLDLLTTNYISDNVSVLLGNGNGGFTAAAPVAVTNGPREVKVGDLDGDGDIDALVTNYSGGNVSVLLNNGTGAFTVSSVAVGTIPRGLAVGDLDGDGDLDFVAVNYGSDTVSVMLNNGSASFTAAGGSPIAVGPDPIAVVLGDFDGDDDLDIATTINDNNAVAILLNNGSAGFTAAAPAPTGTSPRGIAAGDFDGDGDSDLVVTNFLANTLSILLNNGSGAFTASASLPVTGNNPYSVAVGDLDGDGDLDLAVNNSGSASLSVFVNNGSGGFTPADGSPFAVGTGGGGVVMGDFDEDGELDIATTNFNANSTSILLNVNDPPTAVNFSNLRGSLAENTSTTAAIKVADITVVDDGGTNVLSLAGADAALFQIIGGDLWLRAGARLDFETNPRLDVTVNVDGVGTGVAIDASRSLTIRVTDVIETRIGTNGPDTLIGAAIGETIYGLGGNDRILGNGGNDRIIGGTGRDIMTGGPGSDVFVFTSLHDSAPGQSGLVNSSAYGAAAGQGVRDIITDFTPGVDRIDLSAIDANIRVAGNQAFVWRGTGNLTVGTPGQLIERIYNAPGTANDKTVIYGDVSGDGRADFQIELSGLKTLTAADFVL